jgi:hypothetical protein
MTSQSLNKPFKPTLARALVLFNQVNSSKTGIATQSSESPTSSSSSLTPGAQRTVQADAYYSVNGNAPRAPVSKTIA